MYLVYNNQNAIYYDYLEESLLNYAFRAKSINVQLFMCYLSCRL